MWRRFFSCMAEPSIRHISDTALWAAVYRARETDRKDALFRDPFARRLAGERGEQIARANPSTKNTRGRGWLELASSTGSSASRYGAGRIWS